MLNYSYPQSAPQVADPFTRSHPAEYQKARVDSRNRSISKPPHLRLALEERFSDIHIDVVPPFFPRGSSSPFEVLNTLPTITATAHPYEHGWAEALPALRSFVDRCRSSRNPRMRAFEMKRSMWQITPLGGKLLPLLGALECLVRRPLPDRNLDPYVGIAMNAFIAVGLHMANSPVFGSVGNVNAWASPTYTDPALANLCNAFLDQLRMLASHNRAGRMEAEHTAQHDGCARQIKAYLSDIVNIQPRSTIERLELSVLGPPPLDTFDEHNLLIEASAQLLVELKKRYRNAIVADVRKIDHGPSGRCLVHVLLAIVGPDALELQELRRNVLDIWDERFPCMGAVVNCNEFEQFMYRGCGGLICQNEPLSIQLDRAFTYLAETDRVLRIGHSKSQASVLLGTLAGRPAP